MSTPKLVVPKVIALSKCNQKNVTALVKADVAYQQANNDHAAAEGAGDTKLAAKYANAMERLYAKVVDIQFELPVSENRNTLAKLKAFRGY